MKGSKEHDTGLEWREKLYIVEWKDTGLVNATVQENQQLYSKDEVRRVKINHDLIKNSGYPSEGEAVHSLMDGNICGMRQILVGDLERAYNIYGEHPEYVRGQMTKSKVRQIPIDLGLCSIDVMFLDGEVISVSVTDPLNLVYSVGWKMRVDRSWGLGHLVTLHSRNFNPRVVYTDPHRLF